MRKKGRSLLLGIKKLYTNHKVDYTFPIAVICTATLCFITLQPKIANSIFAFKRKALLNSFLKNISSSNRFDEKKYWEFREFYSPGHFEYNDKYVRVSSILELYNLDEPNSDFLYFKSPLLVSTDTITTSNINIEAMLTASQEIVSKGVDYLIYKKDKNTIEIVFVKEVDDMMNVNGLFDFTEKERDLLKGKYWLNKTEIKL